MTSDPQIHYRRATMDDARLLFEWANDPDVRAASFSSEPIPWEDHLSWLARRIDDENTVFLMAISSDDVAIGVIRCQIDNGEGTISITINPEQRGKGLSKSIFAEASRWLFSNTPVERIHAYVKLNNERSLKMVVFAGYVLHGLVTINGEEANHLIIAKPAL